MAELSLPWDGTTGDGGPYGSDDLTETMFRAIFNSKNNLGVLYGWLNELEVTDGGGLNASVDTGGALVYGYFYESDAVETVALPNNSTVHVVVRCSWAAQTCRLAQVAALVQNPGVTYDIPLALVVTAAGVITLITDQREYCMFSSDRGIASVEAAAIAADAITTGILENQTRQLILGAGCLKPDATNPPTWSNAFWVYPRHSAWLFSSSAVNTLWATFRIPEDFIGGTFNFNVWNVPDHYHTGAGGVVWDYSFYKAQPGAAWVNTSGTKTIIQTGRDIRAAYQDSIFATAFSAGDIIHISVSRDGTNVSDTDPDMTYVYAVEFSYPADN